MAASAQGSTETGVKESEKCFEMPSGRTPLEMTYLEVAIFPPPFYMCMFEWRHV